jgi:opacity protein-like surface antigen
MKMTLRTLLCALLIITGGVCAYSEVSACPNSSFALFKGARVEFPNCYNGIYLKGFGGLNLTREPRVHHTKYRTSYGYAIGGALGYQFDLLSVEGEFSYRHNTVDRLKVDLLDIHVTGDIEQLCGFGNILLNIPLTHCCAPYLGGGFGYRHFKPGVNFDEGSDTSLRNFVDTVNEWGVYQLIGGLNCAVSRLVSVQLEYRYLNGWSNAKCSNHTVDLGATLHF